MKNDKKQKRSWLKFLFFGGFLFFLFEKEKKGKNLNLKDVEHNFLDFVHKEGKEIDELIHSKEDLEEYVEDSQSIFRDYFIPHKGNNHHPKILRKKQLISVFLLALFLKVSLVSYLFFIYPNDAQMSEDMQMEVLTLLNEERTAEGLNPLKLNSSLMKSATDKVNDMIVNNYFAHKSLDGRMPWDFVSKREYPYLYIGENLGMSFSSALSVHKALMDSPSHKKNILNEKYTDIGVVVKKGIINGKETNILVQLFGTEKKPEIVPNPAVAIASVPGVPLNENSEELGTKNTPNQEEILVEGNKNEENIKGIENPIDKTSKTDEPIKENIAPISKDQINILKEKIETENSKEVEISSTSPLMLGDKAKSYIVKEVPTPDLKKDLSDNMKFVAKLDINDKYSVATRASDYVNIFLLLVLVFMSIALFLNIFIRLEIQHKPVLIQTFLLLIILFGIYSTRLNFLEKIPSYITIF